MNNFARPGLGATELPPVNAEDNGKVLGVSDGAWAKVAAGGGSSLPTDPAQDGTYALQNTVSSGTSTLSWESGGSSGGGALIVDLTSGTSNETAEEMFNAFKSGMVVRFVTTNSSDNYYAEDCISCEYVEGYGYYFYYGINGDVYRLYNSTDHIELGGGGGDIG